MADAPNTITRTKGDRKPDLPFAILNHDGSEADCSGIAEADVSLHLLAKDKKTVIAVVDGVAVWDDDLHGKGRWVFGTTETIKAGTFYFKVLMLDSDGKQLSTSGYATLVVEA